MPVVATSRPGRHAAFYGGAWPAADDPDLVGPEGHDLKTLFEEALHKFLGRALSPAFLGRMQRFVSGLPGWVGEPILRSTAIRATEIAELALQVAPEPFAAPAMDGSILLKWDLSPDISVEFYVEDIESWDTATVIDSGVVKEVTIGDKDALLALLRSLALAPAHAGS